MSGIAVERRNGPFPDNYRWQQAIFRLWYTGGGPGEVARAAAELADASASSNVEAWYAVWHALAERLRTRGERHLAAGHFDSGAATLLRSSLYEQWAIAFVDHTDPRRVEGHARSLSSFGRYAAARRPSISRVEVPYESSSFPAWFVPRNSGGAGATAIYLPGWDSTKEQGIALAQALAAVEPVAAAASRAGACGCS